MARAGVPSNSRVMPPAELEPARWAGGAEKPKLQPYQEATAWLCQPHLPIERLLVCHRVGSGKTATMIQICDNYFDDKRPKVLIFPTNAVCANFYNEICGGKFPNRFASYVKLVRPKPAAPEHRPEAAASQLPVGRQMEGRDGKTYEVRLGDNGWSHVWMDAEAAAAQDELLKHRRRQKGPSLQQDAKKLLELPGVLRNGRVHPHYLRHPDMPSSPLRAFSYTQAGGNTACGENINALFKCPAGYNGNYATKKAELRGVDSSGEPFGYPGYSNDGNPFSNKIVLMDEVHNLVRPSQQILRNPKRMEMLRRLRHMLRTATNSVIIGLTGTPLCDNPEETAALKMIIKGRGNNTPCDEGFVSFYDSTPASVFPQVLPAGVGNAALPDSALRKIRMRNFAPARDEKGKLLPKLGNRAAYESAVDDETAGVGGRTLDAKMEKLREAQLVRLSRFCSVGQGFAWAGRADICRRIHGEAGNILKRPFGAVPLGSREQQRRALGFATKLQQVVQDIAAQPPAKTLVIIHRHSGWKLGLRLLLKKLGAARVRGYPPGNIDERHEAERKLAGLKPMSRWGVSKGEWTGDEIGPILGVKHDTLAAPGKCKCCLCEFNKAEQPAHCPPLVMVADAMECAEGVSFLGVRRLLLVDVPIGAVDYMQRIGRAVRFMGHASLPEAERRVEVLMYVAAGSEKGVTADEVLVNRLRKASSDYKTELAKLRAVAVDAGTWADEEASSSSAGGAAADEDEAAAGAAPAAADASGFATDEASASESEDDEPEPPPPPPPPRPPPFVPRGGKRAGPGAPPPPTEPTADLPANEAISHIMGVMTRHRDYACAGARLAAMVGVPWVGDNRGLIADEARRVLEKAKNKTLLKIHPDKCAMPFADAASKALNATYTTWFDDLHGAV